MRLESLDIENYKGIEKFSIEGLGREPVVTLSGRNGTGKSLVLEALLAVWTNSFAWAERIGPWRDNCSITLYIIFDTEELEELHAWAHETRRATVDVTKHKCGLKILASRSGAVDTIWSDGALEAARNPDFQRLHRFAEIDYISASRTIPLAGKPSINLSVIDEDAVRRERISMVDQAVRNRTAMGLPHIATFLATLDYQKFLAERQGIEIEDEYARLSSSFFKATGKVLNEPAYTGFAGSEITIALASGVNHTLEGLSSGEQELLALTYLARRLSGTGGILCLDEPEQHLHPALQLAFLESIGQLSGRSQLIVVSHSAGIISASPLEAMINVRAPTGSGSNQATRLTDWPDRVELMADLGITAGSLSQADLLLVVEGDSDKALLAKMLPIESARIEFIVAGGGDAVAARYDTLSTLSLGVPWLCVRDRDFLQVDELGALQALRPGLLVWPYRELENMLLEPAAISAFLESVDVRMSSLEVEAKLREIAEPLVSDAVASFVETALRKSYPPPNPSNKNLSRLARKVQEYSQYAEINMRRAEAVGDVWRSTEDSLRGRWPRDWRALVDAKIVLRKFALENSPFSSDALFVAALCKHISINHSVTPEPIRDFARILRSKLSEPRYGPA